jgi:shikimate kinase
MIGAARRHLYLAGFMGTGKSAAGKLVATALGRPFYDLDEVVKQIEERTVVDIFAAEGEAAFRKYECRALRSIIGGSASVIALGGGAPTVPALRALARGSGRTVLLDADISIMWDRVQGDGSRPVLHDSSGSPPATMGDFAARVTPVLESREAAYESIADWRLDTSHLTPAEVAGRIVDWWNAQAG